VFSTPDAKDCLTELKKHFVLVPVDKAAKNVSLICKRFYMKILLDEMDNNVETYRKCPEDASSLSAIHREYLASLNLVPPCDKVPYTYWTPKFHKAVLSYRFIVSYADCSIKPLARKLSLAFRVVLKQIESFGRMLKKVTGINHCWIINNSMAIVDHLKNINNRSSGRNITTFDFATLYTKLAHSDIMESMNGVIDLAFKKSKFKFISVYDKSSSWSNNPRPGTFKFDASSLKSSLQFILEHSYFSIGSICFLQGIGVPIGVDCAPPMANLTLFWYEYQYIIKLMKSDYRKALKLRGSFRLMDDISSINGDGTFEESVPLIYPDSLELKKENVGNVSANILDLTVELVGKIFTYKLFDKRDKFNFNIVNYPDLGGNISKSCAYGVVKSELGRYASLSSAIFDFTCRKDRLFAKLVEKGYDIIKLLDILKSSKLNI